MSINLVEQWIEQHGTPRRLLWKRMPLTLRRLIARGITEDDIEQTAILGLCKAAKRYDPTRGARFFTYAYHHMFREVGHLLASGNRQKRQEGRTHATISGDIEDRYLTTEDTPFLPDYLDAVNDRDARILVDVFAYGMTSDSVGKSLGISGERVRQLRNRACQELREIFELTVDDDLVRR